MKEKLLGFLRDDEGSNAAEYGLLLALIAIVIIVGAGLLGTAVNGKLSSAAGTVSGAGAPAAP
jgi:pilus assembly protein Flp/PilA